MTTYAQPTRSAQATWPLLAALGAGTSLVLAALGTFWDLTGNGSTDMGMAEYLPVVGIVLVATAVVFGLVVRGAEGKGAGTRAIVLAVLSFLSLAVFWTGLPAVLAAGAVACATAAHTSMATKVALAISALTVAGAIALAIVG
jgi:hypothetical protein